MDLPLGDGLYASVDLGTDCTCGRNEAECANVGGCCEQCEHLFGAPPVKMLKCQVCGTEFPKLHTRGPNEKRCDDCHLAHVGLEPSKMRPSQRAAVAGHEYKWYVARTGVAHRHHSAGVRSICGKIVGHVDDLPVADWTVKCITCEKSIRFFG